MVSEIMMRLKLVKRESNYLSIDIDDDTLGLFHGVKILRDLVTPWSDYARLVCEDWYFVTV